MSDRIKGFQVTLGQTVSEEYAMRVAQAIEMMAEVVHVEPVKAEFVDVYVEKRIRMDLITKINKLLLP